MRILSVRLTRLGAFVILIALAALVLVVLAAPAGAQVGAPSSDAPAIVNLFETAQLVALVAGVIIPFVVALLANASASANLKTFLAFLATGITALGTYLLDTSGAHTWKGAVSVFVVAFVIAATSQKAFTQQWVDKVLAKKGLVG